MKPLALAALLVLACAAARAGDGLDGSEADSAQQWAAATKAKWDAPGAQAGADRGAANAPAPLAPSAGGPAASAPAGAAPADQVLSSWARDCPAIAAFRASQGGPSPKRGIGVSYHVGNAGEIVGNLGAFWYYTWGTKSVPGTNAEFA
ncbi:MAG TPA: hypothetical protein VH309_05295, partial [Elusimicrobiota bacterium]|nr:hypothetical protein [Elusimicrobiota bacterium]